MLPSHPASAGETTSLRIPTSYESAVLGRRILALTPIGTLATVFPEDADTNEHRPSGLGGTPLALMDYIADCGDVGDPTLLALNIETHFRNVRAGSNISLAVRWTPPYPPEKRIKSSSGVRSLLQSVISHIGFSSPQDDDDNDEAESLSPHESESYSAANLPRFNLLGYIAPIPDSDDRSDPDGVGARLAACYTSAHPDAKYWLPGNRIHEAHFVRLVVTHVYWVGGFGDRAYIGWIPVEEWRNVTREEWEGVRLPGEKKGWKEWTVGYSSVEDEL
ncbi:FMN-binding split barrel-related protein [Coniochaeta hoffmannii]|uniref:FMN-binding split barrel-related protein n=1 Tax=Coniochaeta hoffmannii TaxID=91930 RepID=A0AA38VGC4_9PEZI|nr:FMN-binding split barrel-related protein [Coniochaeta hoffmannii]